MINISPKKIYKNIALIVAAGSGARSGQDKPKQYALVKNKPMLVHSALSFVRHPNIDAVFIVIGKGQENQASAALHGIEIEGFIIGGNSRQKSVFNGLEYISNNISTEKILIHDAARPFVPHKIIDDILSSLDHHHGVIPIMNVTDTIADIEGELMHKSLNRDRLGSVQTPQGFDFKLIHQAHRNALQKNEENFSDDAQILHQFGHKIATVKGDASLHKYTFAEDFMNKGNFRIGSGYDVHRFEKGGTLWLGGVKIDSDVGLIGHSDADIVLHALTDALLGALAMGDIGDHFPPSDKKWKGASSDIFMKYACKLMHEANYTINNADITIICEAPKIGPHRLKIRQSIADILEISLDQISVKATTTEGLGFTGRAEGMAVQAQILIEKLS